MSEELQQKLRDQLWEVANKLRGNMSASDFMYFTLGFIFYKYSFTLPASYRQLQQISCFLFFTRI